MNLRPVHPGVNGLVLVAASARNFATRRPRDEIVIWDQNHVTNNEAWDIRAKRFGLKIVRVSLPRQLESDEQVVELCAKACTDRTKVLTFTEVSNVSGLKLPAKKLAAMTRDRGSHCAARGLLIN